MIWIEVAAAQVFSLGVYSRAGCISGSGQLLTPAGPLMDPYGERDMLKIRWCLRRCALYRRRNRRRLPSGLGRIHLHVQDDTGRDG